MPYTKRQLIEQAYEEIGLASYAFDLSPEQMQAAGRRLDSMMATWMERGILVGYPLSSDPGNLDISQDTGLPDYAVEAVALNLGIRLAPTVGRQVMPDTKASAKAAYDALIVRAAIPNEQQYPYGTPAGAGAKPWRLTGDPFLPSPNDEPINLGQNGQLVFNGE